MSMTVAAELMRLAEAMRAMSNQIGNMADVERAGGAMSGADNDEHCAQLSELDHAGQQLFNALRDYIDTRVAMVVRHGGYMMEPPPKPNPPGFSSPHRNET